MTGRSGRHARQRGVTLVELVVAIVVIGIAVSGVLLVMNYTTSHSADPMLEHQAVAVAESYLEEVLLKDYLDPDTGTVCPSKEASRDLYDNVCDYDGLDESGARDQAGNAVAGLDNYRVRVTVDQDAALSTLSTSAQVLRVDVRVTSSSLVDLTLSGYRTNY